MVAPASTKSQKLYFKRSTGNDFYPIVKRRVESYFKENHLAQHGNALLYAKTVVFGIAYLAIYISILSDSFGLIGLTILYSMLGLIKSFIGFNLIHDALHNSFSPYSRLNRILGYWFDINGTSSYIWKISHNIHHHTYTNIPGYDDDINKAIWLRLNPKDKVYWFHRYQNWYAPVLYSLIGINWIFYSDLAWFIKESKEGKVKTSDYALFLVFKALNITAFLAFPMIYLSVPWWYVIIAYLSMHVCAGITISLVFQLAHIVEKVKYMDPDAQGNMENNWAVHEVLTTSNFATHSRLITELFGGLNFQIEHHLFPQVSHVHYPAISRIVRETAYEYNLPYNEQPTFFSAICSHFRTLYALGCGKI